MDKRVKRVETLIMLNARRRCILCTGALGIVALHLLLAVLLE
jgi:hypothetical protein